MESDIEHVFEDGEQEQDPMSLQLSSKSIQLERLIELKVEKKEDAEGKEDGYNEEKDEVEEKEKNKNKKKKTIKNKN